MGVVGERKCVNFDNLGVGWCGECKLLVQSVVYVLNFGPN